MKKFNIGNYKLPHMTPLKNNHTGGWNSQVVGSAGDPVVSRLTAGEQAEATRLLDSVKGTYMDRKFKTGRMIRGEDGAFITGPDGKRVREKIMLTPEQNQREYDREIGEYYVDFDKSGKAKVLNVPRGDDDIPVQSFIKSLDKSQYRGYIPKPGDLPDDYQDPGLDANHPLNPFKGYQRTKNYRDQ